MIILFVIFFTALIKTENRVRDTRDVAMIFNLFDSQLPPSNKIIHQTLK